MGTTPVGWWLGCAHRQNLLLKILKLKKLRKQLIEFLKWMEQTSIKRLKLKINLFS
nr:MAG TPA: hypothetical protein [Caudoviricetes sp.]